MNMLREKNIRKIFEVGLILKGGFACLEILSGVLLAFVSMQSVYFLVRIFTAAELSEDPADLIATYLLHAAQSFTIEAKFFIAAYLIMRGVVKLFLVASLLRNKLWAYPTSLVLFGLFIVYDLYRFAYTHSYLILVLTMFDLVVLWLISHEYRFNQKKSAERDSNSVVL